MYDRDAMRAQSKRLPPLTWEQRDRMLFVVGRVLSADIERGASPVEVRSLFNLLFMLAAYQPAGKPPKSVRPRGRPSKQLSMLFPSKVQRRALAKSKRPANAGKRGPITGSDHDTLRPADAMRVRAMVQYMAEHEVREYAAANAVLRDILPLSEAESGDGRPDRSAVARRLARAYQRFGYAANMPRYQLHRRIHEALKNGDIARAKAAWSGEDTDEAGKLGCCANGSLRE